MGNIWSNKAGNKQPKEFDYVIDKAVNSGTVIAPPPTKTQANVVCMQPNSQLLHFNVDLIDSLSSLEEEIICPPPTPNEHFIDQECPDNDFKDDAFNSNSVLNSALDGETNVSNDNTTTFSGPDWVKEMYLREKENGAVSLEKSVLVCGAADWAKKDYTES